MSVTLKMHKQIQRKDVLLVGCGKMGYSLLLGWLNAKACLPQDVHVVEPTLELNERAAATGVQVYISHDRLPAGFKPRLIVLAVKPQLMPEILPLYKSFAPAAIFVSIAAGTKISLLTSVLGSAPIVRAMPNTPTSIGKGSTVAYCNPLVDDGSFADVEKLLGSGGSVHRVHDEQLIDAATAISGSGPAYVFHFIEVLAEAGKRLGFEAEMALALAKETVFGAGALAMVHDSHPADLRLEVTSPNGTTAAALAILMKDNALGSLIDQATKAARDRAIQLA